MVSSIDPLQSVDDLKNIQHFKNISGKIKMSEYIVDIGDSIGRGAAKKAKKASFIKNGTKIEAVIIYASKGITPNFKKNIEKVIEALEKCKETGITPIVYFSYVSENGYILLEELITGVELCVKESITDEDQQKILQAYVDLCKLSFTQRDENCRNIYFDFKNNVRIIDDITEIDKNYTLDQKKYFMLYCIESLQKLKHTKLNLFIRKWIKNNVLHTPPNEDNAYDFNNIIELNDDELQLYNENIEFNNICSSILDNMNGGHLKKNKLFRNLKSKKKYNIKKKKTRRN
jgi:hypothetical protein